MQIKPPVNWHITPKKPPLGPSINTGPFALTQINGLAFLAGADDGAAIGGRAGLTGGFCGGQTVLPQVVPNDQIAQKSLQIQPIQWSILAV